jgi:hypothetical protein
MGGHSLDYRFPVSSDRNYHVFLELPNNQEAKPGEAIQRVTVNGQAQDVDLGASGMRTPILVQFVTSAMNGAIHVRCEPDPSMTNPYARCLVEERRWAQWYSDHVTKFPLVTVEDVKTWQYITEHTHFEEDFATFRDYEWLIGDDDIATSSGRLSPTVNFLEELCGVENTYYLLLDSPAMVESCFQAMHENYKQMYKLLANGPSLAITRVERPPTASRMWLSLVSPHCADTEPMDSRRRSVPCARFSASCLDWTTPASSIGVAIGPWASCSQALKPS